MAPHFAAHPAHPRRADRVPAAHLGARGTGAFRPAVMPPRRTPSHPAPPSHAEVMRYAVAASLSLEEATIAIARQRHTAAMAKLARKMERFR